MCNGLSVTIGDMKDDRKAWITNGQVAWEIPPGLTARLYVRRAYLPPEDWKVHEGSLPDGWAQGGSGEMRKGNHEDSRYKLIPLRHEAGRQNL